MSPRLAAPVIDAPFPRRSGKVDRERHHKLRQLRLQGREPFPDVHLPSRSPAAAVLAAHDPRLLDPGEHRTWRYVVAGRLIARRKHRHAVFLDLRDQSGVIELCVKRDRLDDVRCAPLLSADIGDIVAAEGHIYVTDNHKLTLAILASRLLTKALRSPPARTNGAAGTAPKYRQRELDLLANERTQLLFEARSSVTATLREYMAQGSFIEVEGPPAQPLPIEAPPAPVDPGGNGREISLRASARTHLRRCLLGGLERVYELGKHARDDRASQRHAPELTMLDWSAAYIDYKEAARQAEEVIRYAAAACTPEMQALWHGHAIDLRGPWQATTVQQTILELCGIDIFAADAAALARQLPSGAHAGEDSWGELVNEIYTTLVQPTLIQPTVVHDHPLIDRSLVKRHPVHDQLACSFHVVIGGCEVAAGESELNDPYEHWERLTAQAKSSPVRNGAMSAYRDREVRLLEYGLCPAASARLQVDRLIMLLTGSDTVHDVVPFPLAGAPA